MIAAVTFFCFATYNQHMADFTTGTMCSGNDFAIYNDSATHTCTKCHHDNIIRAGSCTFPRFSQSSNIGIISCTCFKSCQIMKDLCYRCKSPVKIYRTCSFPFRIDRSRNSDSNAFHISFLNTFFCHFVLNSLCHIRKNVFAFIFCSCWNLPFVNKITVCLEKTAFYGCPPYINPKTI